MTDWFTRWFGKEYLEVYPHRDDAEAREAVQMIRTLVGGEHAGTHAEKPAGTRVGTHAAPSRILDLACGSGRHARVLREWAWTVGLDLSMTLLDVARSEGPDDPYVRADMRVLPFRAGVFDLVVNLFTSFGYFATDAEHAMVLREVCRVTRTGGIFVLDYLNAVDVRRTLVPDDERVVNGRRIAQHRAVSADGRYVEKTISADDCDRVYQERVRLFTRDDLQHLVEQSGFAVRRIVGNYDGSAWTPEAPRVILIAERT